MMAALHAARQLPIAAAVRAAKHTLPPNRPAWLRRLRQPQHSPPSPACTPPSPPCTPPTHPHPPRRPTHPPTHLLHNFVAGGVTLRQVVRQQQHLSALRLQQLASVVSILQARAGRVPRLRLRWCGCPPAADPVGHHPRHSAPAKEASPAHRLLLELGQVHDGHRLLPAASSDTHPPFPPRPVPGKKERKKPAHRLLLGQVHDGNCLGALLGHQ